MDKKQSDPTEQVLNVTLDLIYLLTGEDYFIVKKPDGRAADNCLQLVEGSLQALTDVHIPLPQSMLQKPQNKQKILELIQKMIELLTGEVPIRCQDVTVHFSMEEWEYVEEHKDLYKDIMMEHHKNLPSQNLPNSSTNEYPSMQIKEERYGGNFPTPDSYTPTYPIQQNPSTHINEEPISCDGRNLIETTQQYSHALIKEEPVSCNGGILTDQNLFTPTVIHAQQYAYTYIKEEASSSDATNFKDHKTITFDQAQQYLPTRIKDELVFQEGKSFTDPNIFVVKDHAQQCSSHVNEDSVSCSGGNLIGNARYPSTHAEEGTNLPETQRRASDNLNVQFSCSECKKCFLSMAEWVSHQGIHIAEKLLHSETHVFTTAIVHAPQEPPVKHKLLTCSKCERTFYTKSSLVVHMKTHWREANNLQNETFKCDKCGKCFASKSLLNMHSKLHFVDRPYACSICGERFTRASDLGRHQKTHR